VGGDSIKVRTGDQSTVLSYGAAMPGRYVALPCAVNVGGTGALAMSSLDRDRRGKRSPDPALDAVSHGEIENLRYRPSAVCDCADRAVTGA
jgi:hypothetical protein